jgi:predicted DNA-binding transcriptional regulator AlpA
MNVDIDHPPPALTTYEAAELLGTTPGTLWRLAREGSAPVQPLRLGRMLRWPTRPILELLGLACSLNATSGRPDQATAVSTDPEMRLRDESP